MAQLVDLALLLYFCLILEFVAFQRSPSSTNTLLQLKYRFFYTLHSEVGSFDQSVSFPDINRVESFRAPLSEIDRRRNFAIISHPDAGELFDNIFILSSFNATVFEKQVVCNKLRSTSFLRI